MIIVPYSKNHLVYSFLYAGELAKEIGKDIKDGFLPAQE